jgi:hypothetical protein
MYHLALARFQMGLTEPGLAALEKAIALEPNAEFVPEARRLLDEKKVTSGNR